MRYIIKSTVVGLALSMIPSLAIANGLTAKKDGVEILSEAKKGSSVIKTIKSGEAIDGLERKGMFWEVKVAGGLGYVSVMNVTRSGGDSDKLNNVLRNAVTDGRDASDESQSRSRSAVMGVRGLDDSSESAFAGNVKPNLNLVYQMEDFKVSKEDILRHGDLVMNEIEKKEK